MTNKTLMQVVGSIVEDLTPLSSDDRKRAVQAAMTILGEEAVKVQSGMDQDMVGNENVHTRARMWMRQNDLSIDQIQQVFLIEGDRIEVIAAIPGASKKEQVRNAYILTGVSQFLRTGEQRFDDAPARELCERFAIYDSTNHSKYTKGSSDFTGSRERGWSVTQPGLKAGAALIKMIANGG